VKTDESGQIELMEASKTNNDAMFVASKGMKILYIFSLHIFH